MLRKLIIHKWNQSPVPHLSRGAFWFLKTKLKTENPQNKEKLAAVPDLVKRLQQGNWGCPWLQTSGRRRLWRIFIQVLKTTVIFVLAFPSTFEPLKNLPNSAVISKWKCHILWNFLNESWKSTLQSHRNCFISDSLWCRMDATYGPKFYHQYFWSFLMLILSKTPHTTWLNLRNLTLMGWESRKHGHFSQISKRPTTQDCEWFWHIATLTLTSNSSTKKTIRLQADLKSSIHTCPSYHRLWKLHPKY